MKLNGQAILVTGAGGFIGSHLVEKLVVDGGRVRAFVRYNSRGDMAMLKHLHSRILSEVEIITGDLRDSDAVNMATSGIEHVFHLGALIAIPYSYRHPREVIDTNVTGTLNVLMAARNAGCRIVVHTSTSEVYGTAIYTPIDEAHPLQGQSPYSASKIAADQIAKSFYHSYRMPIAILRPFNTYGPRQSARAVIPTIITQAFSKDSIQLGALDPERDFTYVGDTVDGFIRIAASESAIGHEINMGAGASISIGDLARKILNLMGKELPIRTSEKRMRPRSSEVMLLLANNKKAREMIEWQPRVSLEEGLRATIKWIENNLDRYRPEVYEV